MELAPGADANRRSLRLQPADLFGALVWLINLAVLVAVIRNELTSHAWLGGPGKPVSDFGVYWTVGRAVFDGAAVSTYDGATLAARIESGIGPLPLGLLWLYPPPALLLVSVLALLPYEPSYLLFAGFSLLAWGAVAWRLWPHPLALVFALLQLPTSFNLSYGQNGLLLAAGVGLVLTSADRKPVTAGATLGVLAIKPHLAAFAALPLVLGGRWRGVATAAAVTALSVAASIVAFGTASWVAFFHAVAENGPRLVDTSFLAPWVVPSAYVGVVSLGASEAVASAVQGTSTLLALCVVAWAFLRPCPGWARGALLALAIPLATPYVLIYDLAICGVAALLVAGDAARRGGRPVLWLTGFSVGHVTLGWLVTVLTGVQLTALVGWVLVGVVLWRAHGAAGDEVTAPRASG